MEYDENQAKKPFYSRRFIYFSWDCISIGKRGVCGERHITIYIE